MAKSKKMSGATIQVPFARKLLGYPGHSRSAFNSCVGGKLKGSHPTAEKPISKQFADAAKECKGKKG